MASSPPTRIPSTPSLQLPSSSQAETPREFCQPGAIVKSLSDGILLLCKSPSVKPELRAPSAPDFQSHEAAVLASVESYARRGWQPSSHPPSYRMLDLTILLRFFTVFFLAVIVVVWSVRFGSQGIPLASMVLMLSSCILPLVFIIVLTYRNRSPIVRGRDAFISFSNNFFYVVDESFNVCHELPVSGLVRFAVSATSTKLDPRRMKRKTIEHGYAEICVEEGAAYSIEAVTTGKTIMLGTIHDRQQVLLLAQDLNKKLQNARGKGKVEGPPFELFPHESSLEEHQYWLGSGWCLSGVVDMESQTEAEIQFQSPTPRTLEIKWKCPSSRRIAICLGIWAYLIYTPSYYNIINSRLLFRIMVTVACSVSFVFCLFLERNVVISRTVKVTMEKELNILSKARMLMLREQQVCVESICGIYLNRKFIQCQKRQVSDNKKYRTYFVGGARYEVVLAMKPNGALRIGPMTAGQSLRTAEQLRRKFPNIFDGRSDVMEV